MDIINSSDNVLDLGIFMSSNFSFEFHINNLCIKCSNLSGWIVIYQLSGPAWLSSPKNGNRVPIAGAGGVDTICTGLARLL